MAWALSMGMIRSRESEFGRASSGPTSLRHRATGSKRTRQTRARPGRQTGCRTSHEFADRGIDKWEKWHRGPSRESLRGMSVCHQSMAAKRWSMSGWGLVRLSLQWSRIVAIGISVSEIEFCTLYVVAERWILGCILRFKHAKNHFSDTLGTSPVGTAENAPGR